MATILVCDDDKDIVEAISIYLEQEGHQILKAYDGQQALLVLQKNEVDLLIIDVMMPKLDYINNGSIRSLHHLNEIATRVNHTSFLLEHTEYHSPSPFLG